MQRGLIGLLRSANSSLAHQGSSSLRIETPLVCTCGILMECSKISMPKRDVPPPHKGKKGMIISETLELIQCKCPGCKIKFFLTAEEFQKRLGG